VARISAEAELDVHTWRKADSVRGARILNHGRRSGLQALDRPPDPAADRPAERTSAPAAL
jgi:hypothetical protein